MIREKSAGTCMVMNNKSKIKEKKMKKFLKVKQKNNSEKVRSKKKRKINK